VRLERFATLLMLLFAARGPRRPMDHAIHIQRDILQVIPASPACIL
jgi:hypothetical protein